jgi:hypothetical protein
MVFMLLENVATVSGIPRRGAFLTPACEEEQRDDHRSRDERDPRHDLEERRHS